jgi:cell division protein YceG involved in septum cleavage
MKPIINPWIFYFASVSDMAKMIVLIVMFVMVFICFAAWLGNTDEEDTDYKTIIKVRKSSLIILILLSLFEIFIPDSKTIYQMTVASCITEDNIKAGTETIKETVDYIVDKINESQDNWNKNTEQ